MEEIIFSPSAVSVPQRPLFRCDNQCSENTLSYWQPAAVVVNVGDEANTTNLCQKCFNKHLQTKGRMWRMMGKEPHVRGMWEYVLQERSRVKRFRELAEEENQAGIQGKWQQESPARDYLEQVKEMEIGKNIKTPPEK